MSITQTNKHRHLALFSLATAACLLLGACAQAPTPASPQTGTITVTSHASVDVVPDTASFSVAITAQAEDSEAAQDAIAQPTKDVIARLKELGVASENIQTLFTDVSPYWSEEKQDGYEARTMLTVSNVPVDDVPSLMDACLEAGATEANGPEYYATDASNAYIEALGAAVEAARPKAEAIAEASNVTLGEIVSVDEGYESTRYYAEEAMATADSMEADGGVPLEPGQVNVEAEVTVTFAIK